jgi:hypothetical protein
VPCNEGEHRSSRTLAPFTRKLGRWAVRIRPRRHEETKCGRDSEETVLVAALREEDSSAAVVTGEALVAEAMAHPVPVPGVKALVRVWRPKRRVHWDRVGHRDGELGPTA